MPKVYYHASPNRIRYGEVVSSSGACHMTESPIPHYTVFEDAYIGNWHIYKVEPLYPVDLDKVWDAWITRAAQVIQYMGQARGIIGLGLWRKWQDSPWQSGVGSSARWSRSKAGIGVRIQV